MKEDIWSYLDEHFDEFRVISDSIHDFAELSGKEYRSSELLCRTLEKEGFSVTYGLGSQPTAFRAEWGSEGRCVGFLAEYDALAGLFQESVPYPCGDSSKPGHGCGHNLLGTASTAAAIALKHALEKDHLPGRVVVYGTPAEEILFGKKRMLEEGCFRELDAVFTWHPIWRNHCGEYSYMAMRNLEFVFIGVSAHAGSYPHLGRSALDACELTNVGVNYLREHVPTDVRMNYGYAEAPSNPSIVPERAVLKYHIGAESRKTVEEVLERVIHVAEGAALMTDTKVEVRLMNSSRETVINSTLANLAYDNTRLIPPLKFDEADYAFAKEMSENCHVPSVTGRLRTDVEKPDGTHKIRLGSSDFSEVSEVVPGLEICVACYVEGTPAHSWMVTSISKKPIAHKGMIYAAKIMAATAWDVLQSETVRDQVWNEFRTRIEAEREAEEE